jgi:hypothetical protein
LGGRLGSTIRIRGFILRTANAGGGKRQYRYQANLLGHAYILLLEQSYWQLSKQRASSFYAKIEGRLTTAVQ